MAGADPALVTRLGREAMERIADDELPAAETDGLTTDPHPTVEGVGEQEPTDFEKILAGIRSAADEREIEELESYSRNVVISQSQRYALESARDERRRQLSAQAA